MKTIIPYPLRFEIGEIFDQDQPIGFSDITMSAKETKEFQRRIAKAILDPSPYGPLRIARTRSRGGREKIDQNRWLPPSDPIWIFVGDKTTGFKKRAILLGCGNQGL